MLLVSQLLVFKLAVDFHLRFTLLLFNGRLGRVVVACLGCRMGVKGHPERPQERVERDGGETQHVVTGVEVAGAWKNAKRSRSGGVFLFNGKALGLIGRQLLLLAFNQVGGSAL